MVSLGCVACASSGSKNESERPPEIECKFKPIYFSADSTRLNDKAVKQLKEYATCIKADARALTITGHTNHIKSTLFAIAVSDRMARSVRKYLIERGVDRRQLQVKGYGAERPTCAKKTPACKAKNHRVELHFW